MAHRNRYIQTVFDEKQIQIVCTNTINEILNYVRSHIQTVSVRFLHESKMNRAGTGMEALSH